MLQLTTADRTATDADGSIIECISASCWSVREITCWRAAGSRSGVWPATRAFTELLSRTRRTRLKAAAAVDTATLVFTSFAAAVPAWNAATTDRRRRSETCAGVSGSVGDALCGTGLTPASRPGDSGATPESMLSRLGDRCSRWLSVCTGVTAPCGGVACDAAPRSARDGGGDGWGEPRRPDECESDASSAPLPSLSLPSLPLLPSLPE